MIWKPSAVRWLLEKLHLLGTSKIFSDDDTLRSSRVGARHCHYQGLVAIQKKPVYVLRVVSAREIGGISFVGNFWPLFGINFWALFVERTTLLLAREGRHTVQSAEQVQLLFFVPIGTFIDSFDIGFSIILDHTEGGKAQSKVRS